MTSQAEPGKTNQNLCHTVSEKNFEWLKTLKRLDRRSEGTKICES